MQNDYLDAFYNKLNTVNKNIDTRECSPDALLIKGEIQKILNWLKSDASLLQMKCMQAFFTYVFETVGEQFADDAGTPDREAFMNYLKSRTGHSSFVQKEVIDKKSGDTILYRVYHHKSISFGQCSQKARQTFFDKAIKVILAKWKINFGEWKTHYDTSGA